MAGCLFNILLLRMILLSTGLSILGQIPGIEKIRCKFRRLNSCLKLGDWANGAKEIFRFLPLPSLNGGNLAGIARSGVDVWSLSS